MEVIARVLSGGNTRISLDGPTHREGSMELFVRSSELAESPGLRMMVWPAAPL
jgi:hypothetical protein